MMNMTEPKSAAMNSLSAFCILVTFLHRGLLLILKV
jgi:hypothetical protein